MYIHCIFIYVLTSKGIMYFIFTADHKLKLQVFKHKNILLIRHTLIRLVTSFTFLLKI